MKTKLRNHHVLARGEHFLLCWKTLASGAAFAGLLPEKLNAECGKVRKVEERIRALETELRGLRRTRAQVIRDLADMVIRFASGVRGHELYGENCPFYRALGFIPISENRSGWPRKAR